MRGLGIVNPMLPAHFKLDTIVVVLKPTGVWVNMPRRMAL